MSPILIKTIQFFLSLSLLIVLHELGHFIPAKLFKTKVEKFYLFFDVKFSLFKKKIGETVYGIGWLPLGGYVKIAGMIDESMDTEAMKEEPKEWEFRSKPAWQRLIIMLGGVTVNFILAVIIYIGMAWSYGKQYIPADSLKDGFLVTEKTIGDKLGIQTGDKIVAVDGDKIEEFSAIPLSIINGNNMTIVRDGVTLEKDIPVDFIATLLEDEDKMRFLSLRSAFVVNDVPKDSHNAGRGLQKGDAVVAVNGRPAQYQDEVTPLLEENKGTEITLTLMRNGSEITQKVKVSEDGKLGVRIGMTMKEYEEKGYFEMAI